jgi:hypothetical protein
MNMHYSSPRPTLGHDCGTQAPIRPALSIKTLAMVLIAAAPLAGCEGFSSAFGLKRSAPDEFAVVTTPPLVIPPDYQLRPPVPGAPRPQQLSPTSDAQRALFERTLGEGRKTPLEQQVLTKAQVDRANPDIKQVVSKETTAIVAKDDSFTDQLMFWKSNTPDKPQEVVVDPRAEARRLTEAKLVGADAAAGKTPAAKDEEKPGFLGRMFGWIW